MVKTTLAEYQGREAPKFTYEPVDVSLIHHVNVTIQVSLKEVKNNG